MIMARMDRSCLTGALALLAGLAMTSSAQATNVLYGTYNSQGPAGWSATSGTSGGDNLLQTFNIGMSGQIVQVIPVFFFNQPGNETAGSFNWALYDFGVGGFTGGALPTAVLTGTRTPLSIIPSTNLEAGY